MAVGFSGGLSGGLALGQAFTQGQQRRELENLRGQLDFNQPLQSQGAFQQLSAINPAAANQLRGALRTDEQGFDAAFQDAAVFKNIFQNDPQRGIEFLQGRIQSGKQQNRDMFLSEGLLDTALSNPQEVISEVDSFLSIPQQLAGQSKQAPFQRGGNGLVFNPNDGTFAVDPTASARLEEIANKKAQLGTIDLKDKLSINKDVTGFLKSSVAIKTTANDLDKLSKLGTGPAAIAAVFKFMKANDPTSTVREGEFATAEQSAGVPAQVTNFYNKLVTGERLTEGQIQQFVETSKVLANSAIGSATIEVDKFLNTFGEDLPIKFHRSVRKRTPEPFEITTQAATGQPQNFTSPSGIQFTVGG